MKKNFKGTLSYIFVLFILIGLSMFGGSRDVQAKESENINISLAHGTSGSSWLIFAEGIAGIIRDEIDGSNVTIIPGNTDANIAMLQRGEIDLAIAASDGANNAINGWGSFSEPVPLDSVNSIACLYHAQIHFVVLESLGINKIEEIKEKKVPLKLSVGSRGSGMEAAAIRILREYGITFEDIEKWGGRILYFGPAESVNMLGDGQINSYLSISTVPSIVLTELSMKRDFNILPIREDIIEKMVNNYNYQYGNIPAGSYKGVMEEVPTICTSSGLFATGKLNNQTAYLIAKALLNNIDKLRKMHNQIKNITPEFMKQDMVFPLHPGAKQAYEE